MRGAGFLAAVLCAAALTAPSATAAPARVGHVFTIVLENESADSSFGPQPAAPYLGTYLRGQGAFLPNYYATGHLSLDNYISMVSGQAPNTVTQADCPYFTDFAMAAMGSGGQAIGQGCVYPAAVKTVADQLEAAGLRWRGYMQDMRNGGPGQPQACRHPAIGAADDTQDAEAGDQYATRHNPFVYFHSIIDDRASCERHDVGLAELRGDLRTARRTPRYSLIVPDLCNDGHDTPCPSGEPGGMAQANRFLRKWVPLIRHSAAYRRDGLLVITFDEAEAEQDAAACCGEPPGLNTPAPGIHGPGGGRVGAVLLSPCIRPGTVDETPYNHYGLLRSVEGIFGLPYLGYAGQDGLAQFGPAIFNRPRACNPRRTTATRAPRHRLGLRR